jgi:hypothetical protein
VNSNFYQLQQKQAITYQFSKKMLMRNELIKEKLKGYNLMGANRGSKSRNLVITESNTKRTIESEVSVDKKRMRNDKVMKFLKEKTLCLEKQYSQLKTPNFNSNFTMGSEVSAPPKLVKLQFDSPIVTMKALKKYFENRNERVMLEPSHPAYSNQKALDLNKFQQVYRQAHKEANPVENTARLSPEFDVKNNRARMLRLAMPFTTIDEGHQDN